jgi:Lrp/AsnC family leucine-responsive transcriptional regulator
MAFDPSRALDEVDWHILEELQDDARLTFSELGRRVSMSPPAVAERVRRLEDSGVIVGYHAVVSPERLGRPVVALIRFKGQPGAKSRMERALTERPEILECHHVTGDDCYVVRVAVRTMGELEETVGFLGGFGPTTTSIVFTTPIPRRTIRQAHLDAAQTA